MAKIKMIICDGGVSLESFDIRPQKECEYLNSLGHDVEVLLLYREDDNNLPFKIHINGIKCVFFKCRGKITDWLANDILKNKCSLLYPVWFFIFIIKLKAYLNNNPADFLHTQNLYGTIAGIIVKNRKQKVIFDMREFYGRQTSDKGFLGMIKRKTVMYLCYKVHKILYVHPMQKEEANQEIRHKFIHLPNYPDTTRIMPLDKRHRDNNLLKISYIGVIRERQQEQLNILAKACADVGGVSLSIHGGGNGYNKIIHLQTDYPDIVKVTGRYDGLKDTATLFAECDLLYCCYDISVVNWQRAEPTKMFEAIATKTPCIVSRGSYIEPFVLDNDIGYSLEPNDYEQVYSLIKHLKSDTADFNQKAQNMGKIMNRYTWTKVVPALKEAYL